MYLCNLYSTTPVLQFYYSDTDMQIVKIGPCSAGGPRYSVHDGAAGGAGQHLLQRPTGRGHQEEPDSASRRQAAASLEMEQAARAGEWNIGVIIGLIHK